MAEQDPLPEEGEKPAAPPEQAELETEEIEKPSDAAPEEDDLGDEDDVDLDDTEDDDEPEPQPQQQRRAGANDRIRQLNRRLQESERRFQEMVNRNNRGADPQEQQRQYEQQQNKLLEQAQAAEDMGDRGAVARYWADRRANETNFRIQQSENRAFEREDRAEFRALCREEGISTDLREWVEEFIANARANGNYMLTREAVYNHRLGQLARQNRGRTLRKQSERAERRVLSQTVRAPRGGSDARPAGRRKPESEWTVEDYEQNASFANRAVLPRPS